MAQNTTSIPFAQPPTRQCQHVRDVLHQQTRRPEVSIVQGQEQVSALALGGGRALFNYSVEVLVHSISSGGVSGEALADLLLHQDARALDH